MPVSETSHVMTCEQDECPTCHSKLVEWKQYWDYVWFIIVSNTDYPHPENATLEQYE